MHRRASKNLVPVATYEQAHAPLWKELVRPKGVMQPVGGHGLAVEQAAKDAHRFVEPLDSRGSSIERDPNLGILRFGMTGPDAELEATVAEQIQRRSFSGDQRRMTKVVVEHERPDPQLRRDLGERIQRGNRCERAGRQHMIGNHDRVEAERLRTTRLVLPFAPRLRTEHLQAEPQRSGHDRERTCVVSSEIGCRVRIECNLHGCGSGGHHLVDDVRELVGFEVRGPYDDRRVVGLLDRLRRAVVVLELWAFGRPHQAVAFLVDGDDRLADHHAVRERDDSCVAVEDGIDDETGDESCMECTDVAYGGPNGAGPGRWFRCSS